MKKKISLIIKETKEKFLTYELAIALVPTVGMGFYFCIDTGCTPLYWLIFLIGIPILLTIGGFFFIVGTRILWIILTKILKKFYTIIKNLLHFREHKSLERENSELKEKNKKLIEENRQLKREKEYLLDALKRTESSIEKQKKGEEWVRPVLEEIRKTQERFMRSIGFVKRKEL